MRRLKRILTAFSARALLTLMLVSVMGAIGLWSAASALPDLASPGVIEQQISRSIEGSRTVAAQRMLRSPLPFSVNPTLVESPAGKAILAAFGCAEAPHETAEGAPAFRLRVLSALLNRPPSDGPGRCELVFASGLTDFLALDTRSQRLLAASRIRESLSHDELLSLWISSLPFSTPGPFGLDEAAERLFGKPATALDWNEGSVLALATDFLEEVETCRHPARLQAMRDHFLDRLAALYPADSQVILSQKQQPLPCARPPPPNTFAKPPDAGGAD